MGRDLTEEELELLVARCDARYRSYAETWRRVVARATAAGAAPPSYYRVRRAAQRHRRLQEDVRRLRERAARRLFPSS